MVWTTITRIENSKYGNNSKIAYFDFLGQEKHTIITNNVLSYLGIDKLRERDKVFIIKSFNKYKQEIYLIKKVVNK